MQKTQEKDARKETLQQFSVKHKADFVGEDADKQTLDKAPESDTKQGSVPIVTSASKDLEISPVIRGPPVSTAPPGEQTQTVMTSEKPDVKESTSLVVENEGIDMKSPDDDIAEGTKSQKTDSEKRKRKDKSALRKSSLNMTQSTDGDDGEFRIFNSLIHWTCHSVE